VDFIRSGGMEMSRAQRREELERQERHIKRLQQASASSLPRYETGFSAPDIFNAVLCTGDLVDFFNG
jgi:hypothetical protein